MPSDPPWRDVGGLFPGHPPHSHRTLGPTGRKDLSPLLPHGNPGLPFPESKSEQYTIIEIQIMRGRTKETRKALARAFCRHAKGLWYLSQ
jgi:hypothetical protein